MKDKEIVYKMKLDDLCDGDYSHRIFRDLSLTTSTLMIKRQLIDLIGGFDEALSFWQDYEFCIRACQVSALGVVREHLVNYQISGMGKQGRLTNKLHGWMESVTYIRIKHKDKIDGLTEDEKNVFELMILRDGLSRAKITGDKKMMREFLLGILKHEPNFKNFIKYILNIDRLAFWKK